MTFSRLIIVAAFLLGLSVSVVGDETSQRRPTSINDQHVLDMLPGVVEPTASVTLAAPFDGVLMEVSVREGETARKDQVVAVMDNRVAKAALQAASESASSVSEIRLAERELTTAQKFHSRVMQAHEKSAASDVELDQAQSELDQAHIKLDLAREQHAKRQAHLELEKARVATHNIRAPFSGRVMKVEGRVGQSLNRAEEVLALANLNSLRVDLHVPIQWFRQLKVEQHYWLAAYSPVERPIKARLISFEPKIDAATRTFRCRFEINNSNEALPAGFAVRLIDPDEAHSPDANTDISVSNAGRQDIDHPAR